MNKNLLLLILFIASFYIVNAQKIEISYSAETNIQNFSGNVLLYLSKYDLQPKNVFVGADIMPAFRIETDQLKPSNKVVFDDDAISFPVKISDLERGEYYIQAVFDRNLGGRTIGNSPGNIYSTSQKVEFDKNLEKVYKISCDQLVEEIPFRGNKFYKEIQVDSRLLSDFHNTPVKLFAAISLPEGYYENPDTSYPVIYSIMGFGGDYRMPLRGEPIDSLGKRAVITVHLDGNCPEGHSEYANSDINGPWGDALVHEFIPKINEEYRTNGANLVTGHSSGGWASLWLQIQYPETFAGCWASAPDQVDFRNYQNKNIYETDNMYYDEQGNLTADITIAGLFPLFKSKNTYQMENVVYRGEQLHSFDAVFGAYDDEGEKIRLVDSETGFINKEAIPYWKRYDISLLLRSNWDYFKNKIDGKILITVGEQDNFYLHKAVYLLEEEMEKLNGDIEFHYFPGDHFTVHFDDRYQKAGQEFLKDCYQNWLKSH